MGKYDDKIKALEEEIKKTKYNKATQGHIGILKAKIAQLKDASAQRSAQKTGQSDYGFTVRKSGDGSVILLGFPSTGKSTLLNKLTGAGSEVGSYAFTTLTVEPGMMEHKQAKIQILDVPGIVSGAASGKGRGREVLTVIRNADMILLVVDATQPQQYEAVVKEAREAHIRMNKRKPDVWITKKGRGGIQIGKTVPLDVDDDTLKRILRQFRVNNADVLIRSKVDVDDFIDVIEGNKKYLPSVVCVTKADLVTKVELKKIMKRVHADIAISAHTGWNIEKLKDLVFEHLDFMRIYMKEPRKDADMEIPLIITRDSSIRGVCHKLHKDFVKKFKFARVWGPSAKFAGQRLMLHHVLKDGDILELHIH
ncbi:GTP-binding protein [archaeon]|nr:GTP-binding protein [archaeon]MBT6697867.1 GTP-binding protein [archaeon]